MTTNLDPTAARITTLLHNHINPTNTFTEGDEVIVLNGPTGHLVNRGIVGPLHPDLFTITITTDPAQPVLNLPTHIARPDQHFVVLTTGEYEAAVRDLIADELRRTGVEDEHMPTSPLDQTVTLLHLLVSTVASKDRLIDALMADI